MKNFTLLLSLLVLFNIQAQTAAPAHNPAKGFTENKGQVANQHKKGNSEVLYLLNTPGLNVQLRQKGFSYDFYETEQKIIGTTKTAMPSAEDNRPEYEFTTKLHRIDFDFINANPALQVVSEEKSQAFYNYYDMPWESPGVVNVFSYRRVIYKNLYTGIDLVFSIPDDAAKPVEYNFIIHENGDINAIQFRVSGAKNELKDNTLQFKTRFGQVQETIPLSWAESGASKENLAISYTKISNNVYGFTSKSSLAGKKVIIDPVPIRMWGTYFGGYAAAFPGSIASDALNNVYVSGSTGSTENVATSGTFQSTLVSGGAGYVSKLSPDGVQIWGTYYPVGGSRLTVDADFNVVFSGRTSQSVTNLSSPGAHQTSKSTYSDCYLIKLSSTGLRLWGTYFGGNGNEDNGDIATDSNNNIYFAGGSESTQFIATTGSSQQNNAGMFDGFLAKFTPGGTLTWCTFFGGTASDGFYTVEVSGDNIYASGTVNSGGLGTPGTYKPDWNNTNEICIAKYDASGNRIWSTYAGGSGYDYLFRTAISGNKLYLQGRTSSSANIATPGSFRPDYAVGNFNTDAYYIMSFDTDNQTMLWGTYFTSQITSIAVNQNDELLFCGDTSEDSGLTTPDAYMPVKDFYSKSYLIKLGAIGQRIWGTYYGGDKAEQNCYLAVDTANDIYMHGICNGSMTGIATPGAHQSGISPLNLGATYLVKFRDCNSFTTVASNSPVCIGANINLTAQGGTGYIWTGPDGFSSTDQNPVITAATALKQGTYSCAITGTAGCDAIQTVEILVGDTTAPLPAITALPTLTADCSLTVTQTPTATDGCDGSMTAVTTDALTYNVAGSYTIHWNFTDSSGNTIMQEQAVVINPPAVVPAPIVQIYRCLGDTTFNLTEAQPLLTTEAGAAFAYYLSQSDALLQANAISTVSAHTTTADQELFVITTFSNGCKALSTLQLIFEALPYVPPSEINKCVGSGPQTFDLTDVLPTIDPANEFTIQYYASAADLAANTHITDIHNFVTTTPGYTVYVTAKNSSGCIGSGTIELKANTIIESEIPEHIECAANAPLAIDLSLQQPDIIATLPADAYTFSYYENYTEALNGTANTINPLLTLASGTVTVYYRAQGSSACPYLIKQKFSFTPNPDFDLEDNYDICSGNQVTLSLPNGYYGYKWSDNSLGQTAVFSQAGTYSATISSMYSGVLCETTKDFTITVYDAPQIDEIVTTDFTDGNNSITILPYDENYLYAVDGNAYQASNVFTGLEPGIYIITVKDKGGCGIATKKTALLAYPKYFTPNADGQTDFWHIKNAAFSKMLVAIYDRYGKLITSLTQNDKGWDGTFNGYPMPATDYWFVIQREGKPEFKGHFSLMR